MMSVRIAVSVQLGPKRQPVSTIMDHHETSNVPFDDLVVIS